MPPHPAHPPSLPWSLAAVSELALSAASLPLEQPPSLCRAPSSSLLHVLYN